MNSNANLLVLFVSLSLAAPSLLAGKQKQNIHSYHKDKTYNFHKKRCSLVTQNITESVAYITTQHCIEQKRLDRWLITACRWGSRRSVQALLQCGADPNTTISSLTPLEITARRSSPGIATLLLRYDADPFKRSGDGTSPLERISTSYPDMAYKIEDTLSKKEKGEIAALQEKQPDDFMTGEPFDQHHDTLIVLNGKLWTKPSLMKHVLYTIGTDQGPCDPFTRIPIPKEILVRLAAHTGIPFQEIDYTQKRANRLSLVGIARSMVPLERALSIWDTADIQRNLNRLKSLFNARLACFNCTLAESVHTTN